MVKKRIQWWQRPPVVLEVPAPKPVPVSDKQTIATRAKRSASQRKIKTAAMADAVKRRYLAGETLRAIAGKLGVDHETVRQALIRLKIKRRGRWG